MTATIRNLSIVGYANGFTSWHYRSGKSADAITAPGYFDNVAHCVHAGDFMMVNAGDAHLLVVVTASDSLAEQTEIVVMSRIANTPARRQPVMEIAS